MRVFETHGGSVTAVSACQKQHTISQVPRKCKVQVVNFCGRLRQLVLLSCTHGLYWSIHKMSIFVGKYIMNNIKWHQNKLLITRYQQASLTVDQCGLNDAVLLGPTSGALSSGDKQG